MLTGSKWFIIVLLLSLVVMMFHGMHIFMENVLLMHCVIIIYLVCILCE